MTWLVLVQRRDAERTKGDREKVPASLDFVDYGLMFDSRRSFSLEYDLIGSPEKIPRIVAIPTSLQRAFFTL